MEKLGSKPCCSGAFSSDMGEAPQPRIWPKLFEGRERDADEDGYECTQTSRSREILSAATRRMPG